MLTASYNWIGRVLPPFPLIVSQDKLSNQLNFLRFVLLTEMNPQSLDWEERQEYTLRYKVIRLIEVEGQSVLEMQAPGMLPFTPLMKPPAGMGLERWVQACVDTTRAAPVDQATQADLLYATSLFGCVIHDSELYERLIPEETYARI